MAISYVGGQTAGRVGSTSTSTVTFNFTGGSNTTPQAGDLVVVTISVGTQARTPSLDISAQGYTVLPQQNANGTTYDTSLITAYKFMGGTPDTSVIMPSTGNIADAQSWTIQCFRGVDSTTPTDVTAVATTGTGTGRPNPAAITPVTAGAWVLINAGGAAGASTFYVAPTNFTTNFLTARTADTNDAMVGSGYWDGWTSGAVDPAQYTGGTTNAVDSWAAYTLALRPAAVITDQVVGFTLDSVSSTTTQVLQHNQTATGTLDSVTVSTTQALQHNQTVAISLDNVVVAVSQSVSAPVANDQALAITLDSVTVAVSQSKTGANAQSLNITLDSLTLDVTQALSHAQEFTGTLGSISASISQTAVSANKSQALNITLDDVKASISQQNSHANNEVIPIHGWIRNKPNKEEIEAERIKLGIIEAKKEIKRVYRLIKQVKADEKQAQTAPEAAKLRIHAQLLKEQINRANDEYQALLDRINKNYLRTRVEAHKEIKRQQEEDDISYIMSMLAMM